jgi:DNA-dependent RNA polymerase auxiliary subunit epsilon
VESAPSHKNTDALYVNYQLSLQACCWRWEGGTMSVKIAFITGISAFS